jgi:CRISPR-associated protein Csd1
MIELLVNYARDNELVAEPGFAPKTIKWALEIRGGKYLGVQQLGDTGQKNNPGRQFARCPDLSQPELITCKGCHFLAESASVVALYGLDAKPGDLERSQSKHQFFKRLVSEASVEVASLAGLADLLNDASTIEKVQADLAERRAKPTDKITFWVDGKFPIDQDDWHAWWRNWRANLSGDKAAGPARSRMVCYATGELVEPISTHPKITGLGDVGGLAMGSPMVGFDKTAFPSFFLEQSANAAMGELPANAYRSALNALLGRAEKLAGAKVAYWYSKSAELDFDPIAHLIDPTRQDKQTEGAANERARDFLRSVREGKRRDLSGAEFYALTLSGAGGRVMVRDWMQGSFEDLTAAIDAWFDDLQIVRRDGDGCAPPPKMMAVLGATVRDLGELAAPMVTRIWKSAIRNAPIPREAMAQALRRSTLDVITDNTPNHARMGILRAYHVRRKDGYPMGPYLNEEHPEQAYHCGRLMAVLARLQNAALGDVGAGVVQRYYAAASATPALVLGRLVRTSQFHLNKLDGGLAHYYEQKLASIWSRIQDRIPANLSLEQQSLFALGYYQQLAYDWPRKKSTSADEPVQQPTLNLNEGDNNE